MSSAILPVVKVGSKFLPKIIRTVTNTFKKKVIPPKPVAPEPIKAVKTKKIFQTDSAGTTKKIANPADKRIAEEANIAAQKNAEKELAEWTAKYGPKPPKTIKSVATGPLNKVSNIAQGASLLVGGQTGSALGALGGLGAVPNDVIKLFTDPNLFKKGFYVVKTALDASMASNLRDVGPGSKEKIVDWPYIYRYANDLFNQEAPEKLPKPSASTGSVNPTPTPGQSQGSSIDAALAAATKQATADAAAGTMGSSLQPVPPKYNPPVYNPPAYLPKTPTPGMTGGTIGGTAQVPSTTGTMRDPSSYKTPTYNPPKYNAPMGGMPNPVASAVSMGIAPQSYMQPAIPQVGSSAPIPQYNPPTVATAVPQATLDKAVAQQTGGTNVNTIEMQKQNALNNLISQYGSKDNVVAATQQGDQQLALELQQIEADYRSGMQNIGLVYQDLNNKLAALQTGSTQALSDVANQQSAMSAQLQSGISNLNLGGTSSTAMGGAAQQATNSIGQFANAYNMDIDAAKLTGTKNLQNISTDAALYQALAQSGLSQEALSGKSAARIGGAKRSEAERVRLAEEATRKAELDAANRQRLAEIAFNTQTSDLNAQQQRGYQLTDAETQRSQYLTDAATQRAQQLQDTELSNAQKAYDVQYQAAVNAADSETKRAQDLQDMAYNRNNQLSDEDRREYIAQSNAALQRSQQLEDQNTARLQQLSDAELAQTQKAYDVEYQRQVDISDKELARAQKLYDDANDRTLALSDQERAQKLADSKAAEARSQEIQDKADQRNQDLQDIADSRKFAVEQANVDRKNTLTDTFNKNIYDAKMAKATRLANLTPKEYKEQYGIDASANLVTPPWFGVQQPSKGPNDKVPGIKVAGKDVPTTAADVNRLLDSFTAAASNKEFTDLETSLENWNFFFTNNVYAEQQDKNLSILKKYGFPTSALEAKNSLFKVPSSPYSEYKKYSTPKK